MDNEFAQDILEGLTAKNKFIPDRQYYDDRGSVYFQDLMNDERYYVTPAELSIFEAYKKEWVQLFSDKVEKVQLIEFGAGDGYKTKVLLKELFEQKVNFEYYPIDYSKKYLDDLKESAAKEIGDFPIYPIHKDYFDALADIKKEEGVRKVVLFIGSSLGGISKEEQSDFLSQLSSLLQKGDLFLLGLDLEKSPQILHRAYHDTCRDWAFYLLSRINTELAANIDTDKFEYYTYYEPFTKEFRWYFLSKEEQITYIKDLDKEISFALNEPVFIGRSTKYSKKDIEQLVKNKGLKLQSFYTDKETLFSNSIFVKE